MGGILVTGGGGFLGKALLLALRQRGFQLSTLNRGTYPDLAALGIRCIEGDVADYEAVRKAAEGCDLIFHVAAKAGVWGAYEDYYQANVVGTQNVLKACRELRIKRLVYTSSPSAVFDGGDQNGIDESVAYPQQYLAAYPETKAAAERLVLAANGPDLATVALRPHLIWGPGDRHLIPRIITKAKAKRLRFIGKSSNLVDAVYIDNAVDAHLCAMDRLSPEAAIAGKVYFVSNQEPWPLERIINRVLAAASLPPIEARISRALAWRLARIFETTYRLLGIKAEPPLTRFVVAQLGTAHWYDARAARDELGFFPRISMDEGFQRLQKTLNA